MITVDDDLAIGEFGIATRVVQPDGADGQPPQPRCRRCRSRRRAGSSRPLPALQASRPPCCPRCRLRPSCTGRRRRSSPSPSPSEEPPPPARETVTLTIGDRVYPVTASRVVLGRSRECDVRVADANVVAPSLRDRAGRPDELERRRPRTRPTARSSTGTASARGARRTATASPSAAPTSSSAGRSSDRGHRDRRGAPRAQDRVPRPPLPLRLARRAQRDARPPRRRRRRASSSRPPTRPSCGRRSRRRAHTLLVLGQPGAPRRAARSRSPRPRASGEESRTASASTATSSSPTATPSIEPRVDGLWVSDAGSTNGTFVNGRASRSWRLLQDGDVIRVGQTDLRVEA